MFSVGVDVCSGMYNIKIYVKYCKVLLKFPPRIPKIQFLGKLLLKFMQMKYSFRKLLKTYCCIHIGFMANILGEKSLATFFLSKFYLCRVISLLLAGV